MQNSVRRVKYAENMGTAQDKWLAAFYSQDTLFSPTDSNRQKYFSVPLAPKMALQIVYAKYDYRGVKKHSLMPAVLYSGTSTISQRSTLGGDG